MKNNKNKKWAMIMAFALAVIMLVTMIGGILASVLAG